MWRKPEFHKGDGSRNRGGPGLSCARTNSRKLAKLLADLLGHSTALVPSVGLPLIRGPFPWSFLTFQKGQATLFFMATLPESGVSGVHFLCSNAPFPRETLHTAPAQRETPLAREGGPRAAPWTLRPLTLRGTRFPPPPPPTQQETARWFSSNVVFLMTSTPVPVTI